MKIALVCALFVVAPHQHTSASCSGGSLKTVAHQWSNRTTRYCEYEGQKFGVGSSFLDIERCQRCRCSGGGLSCCGIGFYAGVFGVEGCEVVPDVCEPAILNTEKTALCNPN